MASRVGDEGQGCVGSTPPIKDRNLKFFFWKMIASTGNLEAANFAGQHGIAGDLERPGDAYTIGDLMTLIPLKATGSNGPDDREAAQGFATLDQLARAGHWGAGVAAGTACLWGLGTPVDCSAAATHLAAALQASPTLTVPLPTGCGAVVKRTVCCCCVDPPRQYKSLAITYLLAEALIKCGRASEAVPLLKEILDVGMPPWEAQFQAAFILSCMLWQGFGMAKDPVAGLRTARAALSWEGVIRVATGKRISPEEVQRLATWAGMQRDLRDLVVAMLLEIQEPPVTSDCCGCAIC
jgi:hypothetical protein